MVEKTIKKKKAPVKKPKPKKSIVFENETEVVLKKGLLQKIRDKIDKWFEK